MNSNVLDNNQSEFLTLKEVEAKTRMHQSTIYRMRQRGVFPVPKMLGGKLLWLETDVIEWMRQKMESSLVVIQKSIEQREVKK